MQTHCTLPISYSLSNIPTTYLQQAVTLHVCNAVTRKRNVYRILVGKPEGKTPLGRPRRRWEDNIRMDLREIGWSGMDWIDLTQDGDQWWVLGNTVMNLRVP
jgi:hypothetical protein